MLIPRYYEDPNVLDVGTEPPRAYCIPTSPAQDPAWADRRDTDRFTLLNGMWRFRYFASVYDCQDAFFAEGYDVSGFDSIPVPSNWQDHGYDRHQYLNLRYPFPFDPPYVPQDDPCGAYVLDFAYRRPQGTAAYYLDFEGVDACCYVWLNGAFLGYHQVSHSTAEFDITAHLREGGNRLAVLVLKWCDGSYMEDQDKFRTSGIFRDVYILARPGEHLRDYFVHAAPVEGGRARIRVDLEWAGAPQPLRWQMLDAAGRTVAEGDAATGGIDFTLENASLWNAEAPYLYTLLLKTDGEVIRERVGIREVSIRDSVVYLNGAKLRFRGVNRHDSDPYVGSAVTLEHIRRDLTLMQQHNFNAIRTSHYPNMPQFYELCDEYGFYVIDETDLEMHGVEELYGLNTRGVHGNPFVPVLCDDPAWAPAILDRVQKNVRRDKNRPCVLVWSMGNEAGYGCGFEAALAWTKAYDPDRLRHYEGAFHAPRDPLGGRNDFSDLDFYSRMYASIPEMRAYLGGKPDKPMLQCEFVHAMGNGPGDIEDYYRLEEEYDTFAGGFVWEWCDHAVVLGHTPDGRPMFGYGGDSGEEPHDGNFCVDGLVYPDRTPSPGVREYKNVHRPLRVRPGDAPGQVVLRNRLDFLNLKDFLYLHYELLCDGVTVAQGDIDDPALLDVPPRGEKAVTLPLPPLPTAGGCTLLLRARLRRADAARPAGFALGFDELVLREAPSAVAAALRRADAVAGAPLRWQQDDRTLTVAGEGFRYVFDRRTGLPQSMTLGGRALLARPMEMNVWRAPTDNDSTVKQLWYAAGYDRLVTRAYTVEAAPAPDGGVEVTAVSSMAPCWRQKYLDIRCVWRIRPDGRLTAAFDVTRNALQNTGRLAGYFRHDAPVFDANGVEDAFAVNEAYLPRLGLRLFLPDAMRQVTYLGYGPDESYIDKHRASWRGRFTADVADLHEDYIRPQENGSHWGCEYVCVEGGGARLTVCGGEAFSFNASRYTAEELTAKAHSFALESCGATVLCIDHQHSGIGSGSCGPQLAREYRVDGTHFAYTFHLCPELL